MPTKNKLIGTVLTIVLSLTITACNQAETGKIGTVESPNQTIANSPGETNALVATNSAAPSLASDADAFSKLDAETLLKTLTTDMWTPYVTQEKFIIPDYVVDNVETHLVMRWPEYYLAFLEAHPNRKLVSIDTIEAYADEPIKNADDSYGFTGVVELRYTRKDAEESDVSGTNISYTMEIMQSGGKAKIISIDMVFASDYARLKEEIADRTDSGETSMDIIDSVVDTAIENIR